jgi:hypothetical protein
MLRTYTSLAYEEDHPPWSPERVRHCLRLLIETHFDAGVLPPSEAYEWLVAVADVANVPAERVVQIAWEADLILEMPRFPAPGDVREPCTERTAE